MIVKNLNEGGYVAKALGYSIHNEGETIEELKKNIKGMIKYHFDVKAHGVVF